MNQMDQCRLSNQDELLAVPTSTLSWSHLRVPGAVARLVRDLSPDCRRDDEHKNNNSAFVVLLDLEQKLIALIKVTGDSLFETSHRAMRAAVRHDARSIVVGIPRFGRSAGPTNDDFAVSKAMLDGSRALGVTLLDVVIVNDSEYYSFRELGMLQEMPDG